jgi:hypothetical protein
MTVEPGLCRTGSDTILSSLSEQQLRQAAGEPEPQPPREPLPEECCGGGCSPCVYDRYYDALERYREALRLWQIQHPVSGS